MKKLALLAAVLLLFGLTAGFAETTVDVSGNAEVTIGYNLDDGGMGFENSEDISFIVNIVPESTVASDMGSGWTGYIEFADFSVVYDKDGTMFFGSAVVGEDKDGDQDVDGIPAGPGADTDEFADYTDITPMIWVEEPTVTAKITNGTIWVQVYNDPGFTGVDLVAPIEDDTDESDFGDASWAAEDEEARDDIDQDLHEGGGITVGYDSDMFDIAVYIADYDGYSDAGDFADDWLLGAQVAVAAAGAELTVEVAKSIIGSYADPDADENALGIAASASYTLDAGMMTVVPYVGIDGWQTDSISFTFEVGGGVDLTFTNDDTVGLHAFYSAEDRGTEMTKGFDVELVLAEDAEAGFVPGLGVDLTFGYYDVGTDAPDEADMLLTSDISYMLGDITPFVGFDYDAVGGADAIIKIDAGVKWTGIPMTTILAQWNSGDMGASPAEMGYIEVQAKVEM